MYISGFVFIPSFGRESKQSLHLAPGLCFVLCSDCFCRGEKTSGSEPSALSVDESGAVSWM